MNNASQSDRDLVEAIRELTREVRAFREDARRANSRVQKAVNGKRGETPARRLCDPEVVR